MQRNDLRELKRWASRVTRGQRDAAMFMSLWSDAMLDPAKEPIPVFQLGYAMILDKPIVIVAPHGARVPENVIRAALAVEYYDEGDDESLHAATLRAFKAVGVEPEH
jgi:hypothetical protein